MNSNRSSLARLDRSQKTDSRAGFTLAELLIATGITAGLVLMLGWMSGTLMRTASHTNARVDAFRDARAALQLMERDLRNLIRNQWNPDPFSNQILNPCAASLVSTSALTRPTAYFALDTLCGPSFSDNCDPYTDPTTGNKQLFALVADRTSASSGDVCAVGYYCRWDNQLHAYSLRRFFRDSAATFTTIQAATSGYAADSVLYTPSANDPVLAAYVWNLQITLYDESGNRYTTYPCVCDGSATIPKKLPASIEISFDAMSPQAARTVMSVSSNPSDWMTATQTYQRLILPNRYQFRSRINLP